MTGILELAEKHLGEEVSIIVGEAGPEGQKTFAGRLVEFNGVKTIIEEKGSGERIEIDTNSIRQIEKL